MEVKVKSYTSEKREDAGRLVMSQSGDEGQTQQLPF